MTKVVLAILALAAAAACEATMATDETGTITAEEAETIDPTGLEALSVEP